MPPFCYRVSDYPRVIEPTVGAVELSLDCGEGPVASQFVRLAPQQVHQELIAVRPELTHFFGADEKVDSCLFVLAYDPSGLLSAVFVRNGREWVCEDAIIAETNGGPARLPSARLVFKTRRAMDVFLYYLDSVRNGSYSNPAVAQALDGLAEEIRVLDVVPLVK